MRLATCLLPIVFCACGRNGPSQASFALRDVCTEERAKLEAAVPAPLAPSEPSSDLRERLLGIVSSWPHSSPKMQALAREDAAAIGDSAVPILDALLDEADRPIEDKLAALATLGAIDTVAAAEALARRVNLEKVRDARMRAEAVQQLAKLSSDHVLPRLLAQLKYETDGATMIGIAVVLAKHRNYAGVEGLRVLSADTASPAVSEQAQAAFAEIAHTAGFDDGAALYGAWFGPNAEERIPAPTPSPRLRLEMWRCIANLGEFDLRLVDDARFALSRSAGWVAELLAVALHEREAHIRLHVAQSLERMGPRAKVACDELVAALDEPSLAPNAAVALGSIGCTHAESVLLARLDAKTDPDLRNAAAATLGVLGAHSAIGPLLDLLQSSETLDLRQTAAEALLALGEEDRSIAVLSECLHSPGADAGGAESALERWLARRSAADERIADLWKQWTALAETSTSPDAATRRSARAALLAERKTPSTSAAK